MSMKVNIIGAGISGLSAGCYLQMCGFETQIFEKHNIPGGLCTSWKKGEYTFDGCAHWILGSDKGSSFHKIWAELFDLKSMEFVNHEVRMAIELKENTNKYCEKTFYFYTNLHKLEAYLLDLAPEDEFQIKRLVNSVRTMQQFDLPPIMDDLPFWEATKRGIKMARYWRFFKLLLEWKNETNFSFSQKFKNPFLAESFRTLYDDHEVNMLVFTMPLAAMDQKSAGYPIGGSLKFAEKLEQRYLSLGGKIHYKTPVHKIVTENGRATALLVRNNVVHEADITLSASDWHWTLFEALEGKFVDEKAKKFADLKVLEPYYGVVQFSFGINADLRHLPHFTRFPLENPIQSPDGTTYDRFEVHLYHYDPTMAPEGKTAAVVSYYTKKGEYWINLRKSDRHQYRAIKSQFQEIILTELDKRLGGIRDKVEEMDFATPASVLRYTNNWKGSAQGWLPSNNLFELYNIGFYLPGLKDFFYSSHWSQPGGGLPVAAKQGRDVAKEICKKYKVPFKTS